MRAFQLVKPANVCSLDGGSVLSWEEVVRCRAAREARGSLAAVVWGVLLLNAVIRRRTWKGSLCALCGIGDETVFHVFLECEVSKKLAFASTAFW